MSKSSESTGVYFESRDYIGVGGRLFIDIVDTLAAVLGCVLAAFLLAALWPHEQSLGIALLTCWAVIWFAYFVILKRSRFRTLGYILGGARVVNLQGDTPSVLSLLGLLVVAGGPANFLIDLFWIPSDPCHQAIRDKFAHTYVVRKDAIPAGAGKIVYRTYVMFGTTFLFQEVRTDSASGAG